MGNLNQKDREEANLNQGDLAKLVFLRRETLSVMENGRSEVGSITLSRIAAHTNKPLSYFFPKFAKNEIIEANLPSREQEILLEYRRILDKKSKEIALKQIRTLADIDEKD